jgi:glucose-6-phosphate 1-dehydrogenase
MSAPRIVPPLSTGSDPEVLRDKKVRVVSAMRPLAPENIVRGQLRGYREEESVAPDSQVETFAARRQHIDTWS